MSAFDTAKKFFEACEAPAGWAGCKDYCEEGASFSAQSEPLAARPLLWLPSPPVLRGEGLGMRSRFGSVKFEG